MHQAHPVAQLLSGILTVLLLASGVARSEGLVYPTSEAVSPLASGAQVPSVKLETVRGESVDLQKQVRDRGALLVFFRGGW